MLPLDLIKISKNNKNVTIEEKKLKFLDDKHEIKDYVSKFKNRQTQMTNTKSSKTKTINLTHPTKRYENKLDETDKIKKRIKTKLVRLMKENLVVGLKDIRPYVHLINFSTLYHIKTPLTKKGTWKNSKVLTIAIRSIFTLTNPLNCFQEIILETDSSTNWFYLMNC